MGGMGPAPKKRAEKRRPNAGTFSKLDLVLPAGGRTGPPPEWPLADPKEAELVVWADLWKTPQAFAWEKFGWVRVVARYVRDLLEAEDRRAPVPLKAEVRQAEDRLGLNPLAMLRLRWEIGDVDAPQERPLASVETIRAKKTG